MNLLECGAEAWPSASTCVSTRWLPIVISKTMDALLSSQFSGAGKPQLIDSKGMFLLNIRYGL